MDDPVPKGGWLPTPEENPNGLHGRYKVTKADGSPCDPKAIYFVLRIDGNGSDLEHIAACRLAAMKYVQNAPDHLQQMANELQSLLLLLEDERRLTNAR